MILPPVPEKLPGFPKSQPKSPGLDLACEAMAAGLMLASFDWAEYRGKVTKKQHENPAIEFTIVVPDTDRAAAKDAVNRAVVISQGQNFARTIAARPGNDINPPALAEVAKKMAKEVGLACRVLDEKEMKRLGMGGILAVARRESHAAPDDRAGT